jgi:hypothetical protein
MITILELHNVCPFCAAQCDTAAEVVEEDVGPTDGDVSLCIYCGQFSMFKRDAPGGLRVPTRREAREITRNTVLQRLHAAWRLLG